jgi:hypothetical protein
VIGPRAGFALAVLAALGCGTPSRRLPTRAVDDPITLPRRMMEATVGATGTLSDEDREPSAGPLLGLRYGITDRLSWTGGLLAFEYALLDDAPVEHAATGARAAGAPLGLSVTAGLAGFAYSTIEGAIFYPTLGVSLVRRLGSRFKIEGDASWILVLGKRRPYSWTYLRVGGTFQLLDRIALRLAAFDILQPPSAIGSYRWHEHTLGVALGPEFRPATWVDLGVGLRGEAHWWWPLQQPPPLPPTEPSPRPPRLSSHRFGVVWASAWATFHW